MSGEPPDGVVPPDHDGGVRAQASPHAAGDGEGPRTARLASFPWSRRGLGAASLGRRCPRHGGGGAHPAPPARRRGRPPRDPQVPLAAGAGVGGAAVVRRRHAPALAAHGEHGEDPCPAAPRVARRGDAVGRGRCPSLAGGRAGKRRAGHRARRPQTPEAQPLVFIPPDPPPVPTHRTAPTRPPAGAAVRPPRLPRRRHSRQRPTARRPLPPAAGFRSPTGAVGGGPRFPAPAASSALDRASPGASGRGREAFEVIRPMRIINIGSLRRRRRPPPAPPAAAAPAGRSRGRASPPATRRARRRSRGRQARVATAAPRVSRARRVRRAAAARAPQAAQAARGRGGRGDRRGGGARPRRRRAQRAGPGARGPARGSPRRDRAHPPRRGRGSHLGLRRRRHRRDARRRGRRR